MTNTMEYKKWNRVVGRGIRTWLRGDTERNPTGPILRKVFYFKNDTHAIRERIEEVNRNCPSVGARIDPWWVAEEEFLSLGDTAVELVKGTQCHIVRVANDRGDYFDEYVYLPEKQEVRRCQNRSCRM